MNNEELMLCKNDLKYFIEKYVHIKTLDGQYELIRLNIIQKQIVENYSEKYNNKIIIESDYKSNGLTTINLAMIVHYMLFNSEKVGMVVTHNIVQKTSMVQAIKFILDFLPAIFEPQHIQYGRDLIRFPNNSVLKIAPLKKKMFMGTRLDYIYFDEPCHEQNFTHEFVMDMLPIIAMNDCITILASHDDINHSSYWDKFVKKSMNGRYDFDLYML